MTVRLDEMCRHNTLLRLSMAWRGLGMKVQQAGGTGSQGCHWQRQTDRNEATNGHNGGRGK